MNSHNDMLQVAVVGHTNAGKTSLMRTLARDQSFGAVSPSPATTTEVASVKLQAGGEELADFRDTPGLEDPIGLLEFIDDLRTDRRDDGPSLIERFLGTPEAGGIFAGEAKALRQARIADIVLYVVDARDRVLPRHSDELELLARCGRPVLPVMNFIADESTRGEAWRDALARLGLHATTGFDTVVFDAEDEQRLFEAMSVLVNEHRPALTRLIKDRIRRRGRSIERASRAVAELLVDAASHVEPVEASSSESDSTRGAEVLRAESTMQQLLREHEAMTHQAIFAAFEFADGDPSKLMLECTDGRLGIDLFSREAVRQAGISAMAGAAGGAASGAAIDLAVGGMSLGAASLLGAIVGGTLGTTASQSRRLVRKVRGANDLHVGDVVLQLLLARSLDLILSLMRRGHAHVESVSIAPRTLDGVFTREILQLLKRARSHPSWSGVGRSPNQGSDRQRSVDRVTRCVEKRIETLARGTD
ncbi:MAG: DUF3482 domain-containing protein [Planctomycetota bacterium]|nr:DUF3482 domain-containing protein [Planctomycetota bacterium]